MRFLISLILWLILVHPTAANIRFLTIADVHYGSQDPTEDGMDTGEQLLKLALAKFTQLSQDVDFIINLGDLPAHSFGIDKHKEEQMKQVFSGLYQADKAAKPMFYVTGNNDSLQGNYQSFEWHGISPLTVSPEWHSACIHCEGLIIDDSHMRTEGYYSSYVIPGNKDIILIALNSSQLARLAWYQPKYPNQDHDANEQLQWLDEQLKTHRGKQLLIAMHIPPGTSYIGKKLWQEQYLKAFIASLTAHHTNYEQITLLTSHTHMDDLRRIQLAPNLTIYSFATPSISRIHHNNPGMKRFDLDSQMRLHNFTTYYTVSNTQWLNEQYSAIGSADSIFPQCEHAADISNCLDSLSDSDLCKLLQDGLYYGVKSSRVDDSVCKLTVPVNY